MAKSYHDAIKSKVLFRKNIIIWFNQNKRLLPWRIKSDKTNYPYRVMVSEFMLQQTVVKTAIPYFNRFIKKWPSLESLAKAKEEEILLYWQGLGYYSRAKNLLKSSKLIVEKYNGSIPSSSAELIKLPGIGPYASAAITAIAFNKPSIVIDGNIKRVIARYCGIQGTLDENIKLISFFASKFASKKDNEKYSQGLMEIGALICRPKNPLCNKCIIRNHCHSYLKKLQNSIPLPKKRNPKKDLYCASFIVLKDGKYILLFKRNKKILQNQWELPSTDWLNKEPVIGEDLIPIKNLNWKKSNTLDHHIFSHIYLKTRLYFSKIDSRNNISNSNSLKWVALANFKEYPSTLMCKKALRKYELI